MELVKCSDYVVSMGKTSKDELSDDDCFKMMFGYANFLKRPLELGMFIPCDLEENVLEEPESWDMYLSHDGNEKEIGGLKKEVIQYQQAKERVLFEGVTVNYDKVNNGEKAFIIYLKDIVICSYYKDVNFRFKTIEDLTSLGLTLTQTAIKTIKI